MDIPSEKVRSLGFGRHYEVRLPSEICSDAQYSIAAGAIELWGKLHQAHLGTRDPS